MAENFLGRARQHYESPARRFSAQALAALDSYRWPGNIRELQHVVERSVLLAQQEEILESDFQLGGRATTPAHPGDELAQLTLDQAEIWFVQQALKRHQGNANEAAKALGISRSSLYRRLGKREPP